MEDDDLENIDLKGLGLTDADVQKLNEELEGEMKGLSLGSGYGSPTSPSKDSMFKFFRYLLDLEDSKKVGNLDYKELGHLRNTVRDYLDIGAYANAEGLDKVSDYLKNKAEIIVSTSMSKKGFLAELFVTSIKKEKKMKDGTGPKKLGWFAKKFGGEQVQNETE